MILEAGAKSKGIYLIVTGTVEVYHKHTPDKKVTSLTRGEYFGEFALIQTPSYFTFVAHIPVVCLLIPATPELMRLLKPKWDGFLEHVVHRLQDFLSMKYRLKARIRDEKKGIMNNLLSTMRLDKKPSKQTPKKGSLKSRGSEGRGPVDKHPSKVQKIPEFPDEQQLFAEPMLTDRVELENPSKRPDPRSARSLYSEGPVDTIGPLISQRTDPVQNSRIMVVTSSQLGLDTLATDRQQGEDADPDESFEFHNPQHFLEAWWNALRTSDLPEVNIGDLLLGSSHVSEGNDDVEDADLFQNPDQQNPDVLWPEVSRDHELQPGWLVFDIEAAYTPQSSLSKVMEFADVGLCLILAKIEETGTF